MALADTITALGTSIINLVGTRAKTDLSNITTAGQNVIKSLSSTSSIPVGTVIAYMGTSAPDGFLLMDGGEYSKKTYAALYAVVGDSMGTATDPTKFVIADMTDGRYLMGSTVAGSRLSAGLPNITGEAKYAVNKYSETTYADNSAIYVTGGSYNMMVGGSGSLHPNAALYFDASRSNNLIYGNSTTVTPESLTVLILIKY